jgi:hypothetical protein
MRTAILTRERPIIFSGPSVIAIQQDRKTQTRRVLKPQFPKDTSRIFAGDGESTITHPLRGFGAMPARRSCGADFDSFVRCRYGAPGDRLWVREGYRIPKALNHLCPQMAGQTVVKYEADGSESIPGSPVRITWGRYRSSRYMPRKFARLLLEITEVRVQRVQEISEEDARAEGIWPKMQPEAGPMPAGEAFYWGGNGIAEGGGFDTAKQCYACLWDSHNAKRGFPWSANPWVWAISFKRLSEAPHVC